MTTNVLQQLLDKHLKFAQLHDSNYGPDNWIETAVVYNAIATNQTILMVNDKCDCNKEQVEDILAAITNIISDNQPKVITYDNDTGEVDRELFSDYQTYTFLVTIGGSDDAMQVYITGYTTNEEFRNRIHEVLAQYCKKDGGAKISVVVNQNGLSVVTLGYVDTPLIRENYEDSVLEKYDYIVQEYKKESPAGRLTIINGPPGTGKTYMVRALTKDIAPANIMLIPQSMVGEIDGPSLLPLLMDVKTSKSYTNYDWATEDDKNRTKMPIVLILEDADACLVPRESDNASVVSSLLNYTDGLFGQLLDIRVIATTNAESLEFDQAYMRPGRLCAHINIGTIPREKARGIYNRLTDKNKFDDSKKDYTLAEIYAQAKDWMKDKKVDKKVGFGI